MDRHEPEQLNTPAVSDEYALDQIVREFGTSEQPQSEPVIKIEPLPEPDAPPEDEPIKTHTPSKKPKKRISDDTMVFEPIRTEQLTPDLEAPMKVITDDNLPLPKGVIAKEKAAKRPSRKERKKRREELLLGQIKTCAPPSAQKRLEKCKQGLGMRHLRIFALSLVVLFGLFLLLYHEMAWNFLPFVSKPGPLLPLLLLGGSIILAYDVFLQTLADLIRLRAGLHTLTSIACILAILQACLFSESQPLTYCSVVSLLLLMQLKALHAQRVGQFHTLRAVCSFDAPMGIFDTPKLLENADSLRRDSGNTADFLENLDRGNVPQKILRIYATVLLFLLPVVSYLLCLSKDIPFVTTWLLLLLGAIPCGATMTFVGPFASIAKRLSEYRGALCGWHGTKVFGGKHTIVITDEDLFPKKNITSNGMKLFGTHKAPRIIGYALSALSLVDSPLTDLFEDLLASQHGTQFPVTQHRLYDDGGIGAEIAGDIVLVGSLSFMRSMGVHMPAGTRVRQAVYVSVGGELAGIFAVKYKPNTSTKIGLKDILANRNFSIVVATRDFLISPELIAAKYELPTEDLHFPAYPERLRLNTQPPTENVRQGALIAKDTFGAFAVTVASGRTLRLSTVVCLSLGIMASVLGLLLCLLLLCWNAAAVASPMHIAAFQLLWAVLNTFVTFIILKF